MRVKLRYCRMAAGAGRWKAGGVSAAPRTPCVRQGAGETFLLSLCSFIFIVQGCCRFFVFAIPENLFFLINVCLLRFFPLFSGRYLFEEHSHRLNLKLVITNFSGKKKSSAVFHIIYQAGNRFSSKKLVLSNDFCKISFFTCCRVEILFII